MPIKPRRPSALSLAHGVPENSKDNAKFRCISGKWSMNYGISVQNYRAERRTRRSKSDVNAAFDKPRVLAKLGALGSQTLIEKVAGIDDRLNPAGEHSKRR